MQEKMRRRKYQVKRTIAVTALFITGLSVLLYPFISNSIYQYKADKKVAEYMKTAQSKNSSENAADLRKAYKYNKSLIGETPPDTFSEREGIHNDETYDGILNQMNDGIMACIEIPSIKVKLPIYHYTSKETLEKGAGHLFGSSLPVGGEGTHAVITAHRGLPSAKMFTDLDLMKKGDLVYIYTCGKHLVYEVDQIKTVKPEDCSDLGIEEGKDQITLVTCTPYGKNTDRLLVRGHRTTDKKTKSSPVHRRIPVKHIAMLLIGSATAIILVILMRRSRKKKNNRKKR